MDALYSRTKYLFVTSYAENCNFEDKQTFHLGLCYVFVLKEVIVSIIESCIRTLLELFASIYPKVKIKCFKFLKKIEN